MSTVSLSVGRPTLADRLFSRSIVSDLVLIAAGAAFTSIMAQIAIPLWPVPITMQTFAALLVGSSLGWSRGALSMVLYALLGLVGLPVFSDQAHGPAILFGATGGYIVGFILAAALTGWLAQRQWDRKVLGAFVSFALGAVVVYAVGLPWLAVTLGLDLPSTLSAGLYPFLIGDALKAALAAGLLPLVWRLIRRNDSRTDSLEK